MKNIIFYSILISSLWITACNTGNNSSNSEEKISEEEIGYRNASLYNEEANLNDLASYPNRIPGSAEKIERAFENAPPLIPHTVKGFYPITKDKNLCIKCHLPAIADSLKSTPMPKSHFTNYRPKHNYDKGKFSRSVGENEVVSTDLNGKLYLGRYNCSQCHVPQTNATPEIQNTFEAVFRMIDTKSSSNLDEVINEGV